MTVTFEDIADIVRDTIAETAEDLKTVAEVIQFTAMVTQELSQYLHADPNVEVDISTSRGDISRAHALAWKAAVSLTERSA